MGNDSVKKFRFYKEALTKKGAGSATCTELKELLKQKDEQVDAKKLIAALDKVKGSTNCTDHILMLMKLRSMLSTKKMEKDDKKTTHISLPFGPTPCHKMLKKISKLPAKYSKWTKDDQIKVTTSASDFLDANSTLQTKKAILLANLLQHSLHTKAQLENLKESETKSQERIQLRQFLQFITETPIEDDSPIITTIKNSGTEEEVFALDVDEFKDALREYELELPQLEQALKSYTPETKLKNILTKDNGLPHYGNKEIQNYNNSLKELLNEGKIQGKLPPKPEPPKDLTDPKERYQFTSGQGLKHKPATGKSILPKLKTYLDPLINDNTKVRRLAAKELTTKLCINSLEGGPKYDELAEDTLLQIIPMLQYKQYSEARAYVHDLMQEHQASFLTDLKFYVNYRKRTHPAK